MKNKDNNITNNITNDVTVAGTDLFTDSENFLNELTDSELVQVRGGAGGHSNISITECGGNSDISLLLCQ